MDNVHKHHQLLFNECTFIAKCSQWFIEGQEVKLVNLFTRHTNQDYNKKLNQNIGLMGGIRKDSGYYSESGFVLDIFEIYDKDGKEISELTLPQYKSTIRDRKIDKCLERNKFTRDRELDVESESIR